LKNLLFLTIFSIYFNKENLKQKVIKQNIWKKKKNNRKCFKRYFKINFSKKAKVVNHPLKNFYY